MPSEKMWKKIENQIEDKEEGVPYELLMMLLFKRVRQESSDKEFMKTFMEEEIQPIVNKLGMTEAMAGRYVGMVEGAKYAIDTLVKKKLHAEDVKDIANSPRPKIGESSEE